ncbi:hypothetical protein [Desulfitobacterium sp. PCE1]|uniref:hypothetical protein n=1 Tax=Desulfitobacterium sp. PCE1 TaxID=146907 RepID=UPI000365DBEB|nr:hypothetical protein [Desulfitobacterium sp. PCE1]
MFRRRKPGFAVEINKKEFGNESNEINADRAEEELRMKIDLMDLLDEEDLVDAESQDMEEQGEQVGGSKYILLADFIRERSIGSMLTSQKSLVEEDETVEETIEKMGGEEDTQDIVSIKGNEDVYYYSNQYMSDNYAMIAMLVEEKDLSKTIVEMVRWNCKTYPCPTPIYYFGKTPYSYNDEEIEIALNKLREDERYKDIKELLTGNNIRYFYSTLHMSEKYARALAESTEQGEYGYN